MFHNYFEDYGYDSCTSRGVCTISPRMASIQEIILLYLKEFAGYALKLKQFHIEEENIKKIILNTLSAFVSNPEISDNAFSNIICTFSRELEEIKQKYTSACEERKVEPELIDSEFDTQKGCNVITSIRLGEKQYNKRSEDETTPKTAQELIFFAAKSITTYIYELTGYEEDTERGYHIILELLDALNIKKLTEDDLKSLLYNAAEEEFALIKRLSEIQKEDYGTPDETVVSYSTVPNKAILVEGSNIKELVDILNAAQNMGIDIYTHGEMLPAHGYPELKKYPHLKGNFGTAWQNQQKEFADIPGAVLFTTNCLMPVKDSYADRVFTTEVVEYPEMVHIGEDKDFTPVIEKAIELGGYKEDMLFTGINGGSTLMTGFAHGTVLEKAPEVVDAVKSGEIKHFFLVGGCDGAKPGRNYYTEFVKMTPKDSVVLTLACGKYRFNDLDLGTVAGLPRIMEMGQCNDAYSAIKVAVALAEAFGCSVNELPLSMVISWYEQKAVAVLLTLLHLGIKNIYLGPTLPAFISPKVLELLVDQYNISPISTPAEDLKKMLG